MELVSKRKKVRLDLCIICQKDIRPEKLTSTQHGRSKLVEASRQLKDDLLEDISDGDTDFIK